MGWLIDAIWHILEINIPFVEVDVSHKCASSAKGVEQIMDVYRELQPTSNGILN